MKHIALLLLPSLLNCITVYTEDKIILQKQTIETKDVKEERDIYVLTHSLTPKGLYLFLDAYRVEEKSKVDFIREKYLENKDFKFERKPPFDKPCQDQFSCFGFVTVGLTIFFIELTALPFQIISEQKERIQEEIRKSNVSKIKSITTNNINFALLDKNSTQKYSFQNDKTFIPMNELKIDSINSKYFPYQLTDTKTENIILNGNFDFTNSILKHNEIKSVIEENDLKRKLVECKYIYPNLTKAEITYESSKTELSKTCSDYADLTKIHLLEKIQRSTYCFDNFDRCYYLTRDENKNKK